MARHRLAHQYYEAFVGWDAARDTFFALVQDPAAEEEEGPLLWLGSLPGEYRDLETFKRAFEAQLLERNIDDLELAGDIERCLQADYAASPPGTGMARKSAGYRAFLAGWYKQQF